MVILSFCVSRRRLWQRRGIAAPLAEGRLGALKDRGQFAFWQNRPVIRILASVASLRAIEKSQPRRIQVASMADAMHGANDPTLVVDHHYSKRTGPHKNSRNDATRRQGKLYARRARQRPTGEMSVKALGTCCNRLLRAATVVATSQQSAVTLFRPAMTRPGLPTSRPEVIDPLRALHGLRALRALRALRVAHCGGLRGVV